MAETRRPEAWVATVAPENADGALKEAYDWQAKRLGEPTEYTQLGSLHPELVYERLRLYKVVDQLESGLTETEKHAVVYVTSVLNETPHCASGARHKLELEGVSGELIAQLAANPLAGGTAPSPSRPSERPSSLTLKTDPAPLDRTSNAASADSQKAALALRDQISNAIQISIGRPHA